MKRCLPLLLICLLLTACGRDRVTLRWADRADALAGRETLAFTAALTASYPDKTDHFTLRYERDSDGETVTVRQPETIAGLRARVREGATSLEFDSLILDTGPLDDYGLTPMTALPLLAEMLAAGHLDSWSREDGGLCLELVRDDRLRARVWVTADTLTPTGAQLISDGRVTVDCTIEDWREP